MSFRACWMLFSLMLIPVAIGPDISVHAASTDVANKPLSTFKELTSFLAAAGGPSALSVAFCERFSVACNGKPLAVKFRRANSDTDAKIISIGADSSGQKVVIVFRQDISKATGEVYFCDPAGKLARAYNLIDNGPPILLSPGAAIAGFEAQKKWWMDWLPSHRELPKPSGEH